MQTTDKHMADIRSLADTELNQVSGAMDELEVYVTLGEAWNVLFCGGTTCLETTGTLTGRLHR